MELIQGPGRKRWITRGTHVRITRGRLPEIRSRLREKDRWGTMRTHKAAACLVITGALLAGCSDDGDKDGADGGMVTVEFKVTGDSPASVYIPGINSSLYTDTKNSGGDADLDLDEVKTPWSKKFKVKPGRSLSLQAGSVEPKTEIGCRIFVNGKLIDEETKKNKPGHTLTVGCSGTTSG
ncbi:MULTISPECIES: hypothetical protein [unclassified Streptomyces]|uniref:hypothetical protein n=1 Tax=unclassified Streptomyces TaxID=2593676 RepID=UPI00336AE5F6